MEISSKNLSFDLEAVQPLLSLVLINPVKREFCSETFHYSMQFH